MAGVLSLFILVTAVIFWVLGRLYERECDREKVLDILRQLEERRNG